MATVDRPSFSIHRVRGTRYSKAGLGYNTAKVTVIKPPAHWSTSATTETH